MSRRNCIITTSKKSKKVHERTEHPQRPSASPGCPYVLQFFCYQAKKWNDTFATALGGLDTLMFAGNIGENAPIVCTRICDGPGFPGIELDEKKTRLMRA